MNAELKDVNDLRGPGVSVAPFWVAWFVFGSSCVIGHYFPSPIIDGTRSLTYAGYLVMAIGLYMAVDGYVQLNKAKTGVLPWKPTTSIVKCGVYRYTRNPLYLSLWLLLLGIGFVLDRASIVTGSFFFLLITYYVAVRKEEAYLEAKFGEEYLLYKKKTHRWI